MLIENSVYRWFLAKIQLNSNFMLLILAETRVHQDALKLQQLIHSGPPPEIEATVEATQTIDLIAEIAETAWQKWGG